MKKVVWANKSNGQLCVTIPKGSGIKEGDIVDIEKQKITKIVYTTVTADLFHFGHLQLLQKANEVGDLHVCGVLTDAAIESYKSKPVATLTERKAIISDLRCVDMVMTQDELDPTTNLQQLHDQFPHATIILVFGSNWENPPGVDYVTSIGGQVCQPEFYDRLSLDKITKQLSKQVNA